MKDMKRMIKIKSAFDADIVWSKERKRCRMSQKKES